MKITVVMSNRKKLVFTEKTMDREKFAAALADRSIESITCGGISMVKSHIVWIEEK